MATLTDQSGNSRHYTQSTSANKPVYKTGQINSLAASYHPGAVDVSLSGPPGYFIGPNMTALTAAHVFVVAKKVDDVS